MESLRSNLKSPETCLHYFRRGGWGFPLLDKGNLENSKGKKGNYIDEFDYYFGFFLPPFQGSFLGETFPNSTV